MGESKFLISGCGKNNNKKHYYVHNLHANMASDTLGHVRLNLMIANSELLKSGPLKISHPCIEATPVLRPPQ